MPCGYGATRSQSVLFSLSAWHLKEHVQLCARMVHGEGRGWSDWCSCLAIEDRSMWLASMVGQREVIADSEWRALWIHCSSHHPPWWKSITLFHGKVSYVSRSHGRNFIHLVDSHTEPVRSNIESAQLAVSLWIRFFLICSPELINYAVSINTFQSKIQLIQATEKELNETQSYPLDLSSNKP